MTSSPHMKDGVDMDQVELKVRDLVPEYGRIYHKCAASLERLTICRQQQGKNCHQLGNELADCSHEAMCPAQFDKLIQCTGDKPAENFKKCQGDAIALQTCIQGISEQVAKAFDAEYNKARGSK